MQVMTDMNNLVSYDSIYRRSIILLYIVLLYCAPIYYNNYSTLSNTISIIMVYSEVYFLRSYYI